MRSQCAVYVDAGYLLAAAATRLTGTSLRSGISADYEKLVRQIRGHAETRSGLPLLRVHWYDAAREGRPNASHDEIGLLPHVKVRLGRIGYDGEQKGVDLRIGLDMVAHARNGAAELMYLVSGDDDLTEAVEEVQSHGVQVTILAVPGNAGSAHAVSTHLQRAADGLELLDAQLLDAAVRRSAAAIAATIALAPTAPPAGSTASGPVPAGPVPAGPVPAGPVPAGPVPAAAGPSLTASPSPAMFAHRTSVRSSAPAPAVRDVDVVYSSRTGGPSTLSPDYSRTSEQLDDIIDTVVDRLVSTWLVAATPVQIAELLDSRPSIPREIDRALLRDASDALGVYDLSDAIRYELRGRFWQTAERHSQR